MRSPCCLCVCVSPLLTSEFLNQFFNETWFVYHGTRANLSGVIYKSLPSVCVSVCVLPIVARQRLG
jgi:uncharacterized membrane protein